MSTAAKIEDIEAELAAAKRAYLVRFGWTETCDNPGAYWLWRRDFADLDAQRHKWSDERGRPRQPEWGVRHYPMDMAVSITASQLDTDFEEHEDDDA